MTYRNDIDALTARKAALDVEVEQRTKERDEAARLLADALSPKLDNIRVASPCKADWSQMVGDDRVRHCGLCKQNVYNLSAMSREQAEALLHETAGQLCARYYRRKDGTILTSDCSVGVRGRRRVTLATVGSALAIVVGASAVAEEEHIQGSIGGPPRPEEIAKRELEAAQADEDNHAHGASLATALSLPPEPVSLPIECEGYRAVLRTLQLCGHYPDEYVDEIEREWQMLEESWYLLPPRSVELVRQSCVDWRVTYERIHARHCANVPLEQRDHDRGSDRDHE